jgi:hypothetical protein
MRIGGVSPMTIGKRMLLLMTYIAISSAIAWFFAIGGGVYAPLGIFMSWGFVLVSGLESGPAFLLLVYLIYVFMLFLLNTLLSKIYDRRFPLLPLAIHIIGGCLAVLDKNILYSYSILMNIFGFAVSVPVTILYWALDWRLASAHRGKPFFSIT